MSASITPVPEKGPLTTVRNYVDAFNRGDLRGMVETFAVPASILDGMPPHVWQGPTAAKDWYRDVLLTTMEEGASDFFVSLGEPLHSDVTGESAYLVVPAAMSFRVHDKQVTQSNAIFTLALRRIGEDWRIAAWAWAKGRR